MSSLFGANRNEQISGETASVRRINRSPGHGGYGCMMDKTEGRPERLSSILNKVVRRRALAQTGSSEALRTLWKQAVGDEINAQTSSLKLRHGVLQVECSHASVASEIRAYHEQRVILSLQQELGSERLRKLTIKVAKRQWRS